MTLRTRLLAGGLLLIAAPAAAQTAPVSEVIVSAARLPTPLIDLSGAKVIDRAEIERRNAVVAADVLDTVPGAALSRNGAFGGVTSLRLRGMASDKSLVLIDGVPVNDPSQPAGSYDFAGLDLADVDRIEILAGPQGSLWGSDAIGGVVNVVTRETDGVRASAEAGSYDTWRTTGAAGVTGERGAFSVSGAAFRSAGISKADARDGNTEQDAFKNLTAGAAGRFEAAPGVTLEGRLRYNRAKSEYDSFGGPTGVIDGPDTSDVESLSGFARATVKGPWGFSHAFTADVSTIERAYGGAFPYEAEGGRNAWRWLARQDESRPLALAFGLERENQREDTGDGRRTTHNTAAFAIARWAPAARLSFSASLRRDDPEASKGRTTLRLSGRGDLGAGFSLAASFGQGFKVPSLYQSTYPCFECAAPGPNTALKPERAEGYDLTLGWEDPQGRGGASVTLYRLKVRDRIDYAYPTGYLNIARSRSTGVEAQGRWALGGGFAVRGGYAWTDAEDTLAGAQLRVPRHSGSLGLDWTGARLQAAALARAQSGAPDTGGRIKGFTTVELSGSYRLSTRARLTLRVENLFDRHYQAAYGYGEPGRSAYAGVSLAY